MSAQKPSAILIEPLREEDLEEADRIFRLAFGTFLGLPDPTTFAAGTDFISTRWKAAPDAAFAARHEGRLVGSNFATNWGTVGFFGPLTIHPDYWDRGIGKRLLEPVMQLFSNWNTRHAGLFTFAQSPKHVGLYQRFGFWPRFLTMIMSAAAGKDRSPTSWQKFSELSGSERQRWLDSSRKLTNELYEGLDLEPEIYATENQSLGETVFISDNSEVSGLAICHCGPATEAGPDTCYIKFGAASPGSGAAARFDRLLTACDELALERGLSRLSAGVNTARTEAYQQMLARGFKTDFQGVTMHRPNEAGYSRSDIYVIDDWR